MRIEQNKLMSGNGLGGEVGIVKSTVVNLPSPEGNTYKQRAKQPKGCIKHYIEHHNSLLDKLKAINIKEKTVTNRKILSTKPKALASADSVINLVNNAAFNGINIANDTSINVLNVDKSSFIRSFIFNLSKVSYTKTIQQPLNMSRIQN